jgi:sec-independent protein translocase protein TatA
MPVRIGPGELVLLIVLALIIFGPSRIADLGGQLGKGIRAFQDGLKGNDESADKGESSEEKAD